MKSPVEKIVKVVHHLHHLYKKLNRVIKMMHSMVLRVRGSCYDKELIFLLVLYFCNKIKIENCLITGILIKKAFGTICIQKLVRNSVTRKGVTCDVYEEEQSSVLMSL